MDTMQTVGLWVGLHVLLLLFLKGKAGSTRGKAGSTRGKTKVNFGDGNNEQMQQALRVQGNAVEDVPIAMIGLIMLGVLTAPIWLLHTLGGTMFVSRILHAYGLGKSSGYSFGRLVGTLRSMIAQLAIGIACLWFVFT